MHKIIGILFAIACFATSSVSNSIMGAGLWFWGIIASGFVVALSQFIPIIRGAGSGLALIISFISIFAILFGLVAATIGGSFNMDDSSSLLLFLFFIVSILGLLWLAFIKNLYAKMFREIF